MGGYFKFGDVCSQETANTQTALFEYEDGKILQFEVRGLYTAGEDSMGVKIGNLFYGTEGWMEVKGSRTGKPTSGAMENPAQVLKTRPRTKAGKRSVTWLHPVVGGTTTTSSLRFVPEIAKT